MHHCVSKRLLERKHQRYALPNVDALLLHLGNGEPQRLHVRVRELYTLPLSDRLRNALFKLLALNFAVRKRHAQHLRHLVAQRLREQQPQWHSVADIDAHFIHLGDGKP